MALSKSRLLKRIGFTFLTNYHAPAELLLYGTGWQVATPSPDDQIATTLAGDHTRSAVPGYDPRLTAAPAVMLQSTRR